MRFEGWPVKLCSRKCFFLYHYLLGFGLSLAESHIGA